MLLPRPRLGAVVVFSLSGALACGGAPKPAPSPGAKGAPQVAATAAVPVPPEPVARSPRTGALVPVDDPKVDLHVVGHAIVGDREIFEVALPRAAALAPDADVGNGTWVAVSPADGTLAFVGYSTFASAAPARTPRAGSAPSIPAELRIWIRRPKSDVPLSGTLYTPASLRSGNPAGTHGHRIPFVASLPATAPVARDVERRWATSLATELELHPGVFYRFAAERTRVRFLGAKPGTPQASPTYRRDSDFAELMDTMTGRLSVQEALQSNKRLFFEAARQKPKTPVSSLRPPALSTHPWGDLLRALRASPPEEPFAVATPAAFYFVRARTLTALFEVIDAAEDWGKPALDFLDGRNEERGTFARYQTELGIERSEITRILGPELVQDLAIVGSDPYIHEGTDLTVLFHTKNATLFRASIEGVAARTAAERGGSVDSTFAHEGITVTVKRSKDGRLRQHRATVGDMEIISNSPAAMKRVISTIHGNHPRLSDQPDFSYMLARDRGAKDDLLLYFGDAFVGAVVGPEQKIGEARRQIALAELSQPGYAALLHGFIEGRAPTTTDELLRSRLLDKSELRHQDGTPIDFAPGTPAHSKWGSPQFLEPLIDLPAVTEVSLPEQRGYESFARAYESLWSDKIDPVALRVHDEKIGPKKILNLDLRVLPLLRNDYRELVAMVGNARARVPNTGNGARLVVGIGQDAELRRELSHTGRSFGFGNKLVFDWLGDYAIVGVANRNELSNAVLAELAPYLELPAEPRPSDDAPEISHLADLPIYAAVAVKSRVAAAVALALVREVGEKETIGVVRWGKKPDYRGQQISTVVGFEGRTMIILYYSLLPDALVASFNEPTLHGAIDDLLDAPPIPVRPGENGDVLAAQAILDMAGNPTSPLYRSLGWAATAALLEQPNESPSLAEAVLRGDPAAAKDPERARAVARAVFGVVPLTLDGREFSLGPEGMRFPGRGSANAPEWPDVPLPGSPLEKVLGRLGRIRTALSFDDEPGSNPDRAFRSLHARVTFEIR